jgi:hypothetical protein
LTGKLILRAFLDLMLCNVRRLWLSAKEEELKNSLLMKKARLIFQAAAYRGFDPFGPNTTEYF